MLRTVSICVDQYPSVLYPELGKQRCSTQLTNVNLTMNNAVIFFNFAIF